MKKCLSKWPKLIFARHLTSYYGNFFTVHANQYCLMSQSRIWKYHALFFLKDLSSVVSTCKKTVEMCCIGSSFAIFQMIWKLTIPSLSSWWIAVYYTAVEGVSSFESKAGKWNQPWGVTIEMKASEQLQGLGGTPYDGLYGLAPPEIGGTFFRLQVYERVGISLIEVYKRVGKSVIWVCERAQKS